jgi:hypothetical protein
MQFEAMACVFASSIWPSRQYLSYHAVVFIEYGSARECGMRHEAYQINLTPYKMKHYALDTVMEK